MRENTVHANLTLMEGRQTEHGERHLREWSYLPEEIQLTSQSVTQLTTQSINQLLCLFYSKLLLLRSLARHRLLTLTYTRDTSDLVSIERHLGFGLHTRDLINAKRPQMLISKTVPPVGETQKYLITRFWHPSQPLFDSHAIIACFIIIKQSPRECVRVRVCAKTWLAVAHPSSRCKCYNHRI